MKSLSSASRTRIFQFIDELFDNMSLQLLGEVPSLRGKKTILFSSKPDLTLGHLFLKSLGASNLSPQEQETLKSLISKSEEYIGGLRAKTKTDMLTRIESYMSEKAVKGQSVSTVDIRKEIEGVLDKAKSHFTKIAEHESTTARNLGNTMSISKVAASQGISDPNVFFSVIKDDRTCDSCTRLHLLPDGVTPRVWKLSDIGFGYGKKSDTKPTLTRHPHCRCGLSFLAPNFGFQNGYVSFISLGHDEYEAQKGK